MFGRKKTLETLLAFQWNCWPVTMHSNLRQFEVGFTAMWWFIIGKFPGVSIPHLRVNYDAIDHTFLNVRGAARDNTNSTIQQCCAGTRHATTIQIFCNTAGNSGSSQIMRMAMTRIIVHLALVRNLWAYARGIAMWSITKIIKSCLCHPLRFFWATWSITNII